MLKALFTFSLVVVLTFCSQAQTVVPINNYSVNNFGQVELEIEGQADKYYLLTANHVPNSNYESVTSMTMGVDGTMIISEPLAAFPLQNYKVTEHSIATPDDTDGDGIDDVTEFNDLPTNSPLNFAEAIPFIDGTTSIDDYETFASLAVVADVPWAPFLNGQEFVKFAILDRDTDEPKVYFINSNTHFIHQEFLDAIPAVVNGDDGSGEIVFNPNEILPNGSIGSYSFNFSFGDALSFEATQRTMELLVANMPYLNNNMQHFIGTNGEAQHISQHADNFVGSRINVVFESEVFGDVDYIPFNEAEGYGFFRQMTLDENPGSRDIVLYDALPNSLPRVGGIITSVVQTPLSHVNLRAIQDNVPNAYIKDPLQIDSISNLIGKYIYYKVESDHYNIREATLEEVNAWYEKLRPTEEQIPERDLSFTEIMPLDSIKFEMSTAFGAKCSNVATMRTFGFPDGTIPDGFGIPFYYYDEFMKFNGFYDKVEIMINDPQFINDLETRIQMLKDLRKDIREAPMPQWMMDNLQAMHDQFPEGTAVRCRSSTNNEDLPGFSGAGLYTSKTQHLDEGHISKSIKQVYASMWNFRAYDERDFYRVDHYIAAMGVLCHPNFQEEKSNGVGVSIDPIYNTENTFYLNTQVGEFLITNPDANSIPEEILLSTDPEEGYVVLRRSNLIPDDQLVMDDSYLDLMRDYLQVIHDEFAELYNVVGAEGFGMDIEYKVDSSDQLVIKQARPWVSFWADIKANRDLAAVDFIAPTSSASLSNSELVTVNVANKGLENMENFDLSLLIEGTVVETMNITDVIGPQNSKDYQFSIPQDFSTIGDYNIGAIVSHPDDGYRVNDTLNTVLSKLHFLEGGISILEAIPTCGQKVDLVVQVENFGETTFIDTEIEVVVNGLIVDTIHYNFSIPYLTKIEIEYGVTENLQLMNNEIVLNLLRVNDQYDAESTNNSDSVVTDLDSAYENFTLIINPDDYPEEVSWALRDALSNDIVAAGFLVDDQGQEVVELCVDPSSCFVLSVFDSFGDGICCGFGEGDFTLLNNSGETIIYNNGDFGSQADELFCPNGEGCAFETTILTTIASDENTADGEIFISLTGGLGPFQFSIDGGQTFSDDNLFDNLPSGEYDIVVVGAGELCSYEETIFLEADIMDNTDEITLNQIKLFPNPTRDIITIEFGDLLYQSESIQLEIYDALGRSVYRASNIDVQSPKVISLSDFKAGSYIVKCASQDFEKHFKVLKLD